MNNPTVIEVIMDYAKEHGFDGLYSTSADCGCEIVELCPCDGMDENCTLGYKNDCSTCGRVDDCDLNDCDYDSLICAEKCWVPK